MLHVFPYLLAIAALLGYYLSLSYFDGDVRLKTKRRSQAKRFRDDRRMRSFIQQRSAPRDGRGPCPRGRKVAETFDGCAISSVDVEQVDPQCDGLTSKSEDPKSKNSEIGIPCASAPLLEFGYEQTIADSSNFGAYCRAWLKHRPSDTATGRHRDLFHVPLVLANSLLSVDGLDDTLVLKISNLCIIALNFLWDDCPIVPRVPKTGRANAAQCKVQENVVRLVRRMMSRLSSETARMRDTDLQKDYPRLVSDLVEMCPEACTCDSMSYVSESLREAITSEGGLFRGAVQNRTYVPKCSSAERDEYAKVTARGLLSGKLRLRREVHAGGSIFAVPKASGGQREVWHGRYVSSLAASPPKPCHQPTPACLIDLEASPARPLYLSKRDAVSYFDCLTAPSCVRGWFARPRLRADELMKVFDLSMADSLSQYIDGSLDTVIDQGSTFHPVACCWPMGFSWSSAVAQDVMLSQVASSGLDASHLLADDKASPDFSRVDECVAVCTDDVMHFARSPEIARRRLQLLDDQWQCAGILRRPDKDLDWSTIGTTLGCDFDGGQGFLDANSSKEIQVLFDAAFILSKDLVTPDSIMKLMGSMQWFDLLNRNKLAMYDSIYLFEQMPSPESAYRLPGGARSDLQASLALAPFWCADLSREHLPFISATDASSSYGFGVCIANASAAVIRKVASFAEKRGDYVVLEDNLAKTSGQELKPRAGFPRHLGLKQADFKTILSVRAQHPAHNNILEGEAYLLWLRWLLQNTSHHNCRATCLVDSKVVLGGVMKGRSSSKPLLRLLRRVAAMQLVGNVLVRLVYVPTDCNPSDPPSRGIRVRASIRKDRYVVKRARRAGKQSRFEGRLSREISNSPHADELWRLLEDDPDHWKFV